MISYYVYTNYNKCDPTWENRAYVHIKFDHFLNYENSLLFAYTFFINEPFATSRVHNGQRNGTYRTCIAYTEGEISGIM